MVCHATDYVWTGAAKDGFWTTQDNWSPNTGYPRSGDNVTLPPATAKVTINLHGDQAVRSLTFNPQAPFCYAIEGNTLTLDDGGNIRFLQLAKDAGMDDAAVQVITSDIKLAGNATIGNENRWYFGGELLSFRGRISGAGNITIASERGGCVGFMGDNTAFTGNITINKGMLFAGHRTALGSGSQPVVMNGGDFWIAALPTVRDFRIAANAGWSAVMSPSGPHSGTITVCKDATWQFGTGGNSSTLLSPIAGDGNLVWSGGAGTTVGGTAPNTMSGSYAVGGGRIILAKPAGVNAVGGPLTLNAGAKLEWGADEQIGDALPLKFGGDLCEMNLNGHRETLGTLDLQGHAVIECGKGNNHLHAADSHGVAWNNTKELVINAWKGNKNGGGSDVIMVGGNAAALTPGQVACIGFRNPAGQPAGLYRAAILKTGEVVPAAAAQPVNPPYDLSDKAMAERRRLYEIPGRANLGGKNTPLKKDMKIAFFGDSITWGGGYIGVIDQALKTGEGTKDLGVKLINHGVNGGGVLTLRDGDDSKSHVGDTKPRPFAENLAEDKPQVAVIFIGINDIWWRKTSPADFEKALRDLVATATANKTIPVLATLSVWGDDPSSANANNPKCDENADITRKVAAATGTTLVDLRKACYAYLQNHNVELRLDGSLRFYPTGILTGDGVHANGQGCDLLADMISRGIVEALGKPSPAVPRSGNPLFPGWYADPEVAVFGKTYWIYPTFSARFPEQLHLDAFSSPDLVHWTKHPRVLEQQNVPWLKQALWAPAVIAKDGRYYCFFGGNNIQNDTKDVGGIGVAVADSPAGPFVDLLGKPLIGVIRNGAQPIDQFVFHDTDGKYYIIYGGWGHCNIARLKDDFTALVPLPDGSTFKEITPEKYVEGPFMFLRKGKYYLMWSEGNWGGPEYSVAYGMADSPMGPFKRVAKVLQQDPAVATGAGHHSVMSIPGTDDWYVVYHRRPLTETDANHRVTCIDRMYFDDQGAIQPIKITTEGVERRTLDGKP